MSDRKANMSKRTITQKKTFTKWVNNHLRRKRYETVDDILTCWKDGWKLAQLTNSLYSTKFRRMKKKEKLKMKPQCLDNISQAMDMLEKDAKVKTNFLKVEHLYDEDMKMILGMVWAIILDYAIKGIQVDDKNAKEGLLLWVRKMTKGYRDVDVTNFSTSWKDGMAISALIHRFNSSYIDYDSLDKKNKRDNVEQALKLAEEKMGIPQLVDVEDLCDVSRPDEKAVMTYVAEFFHKFGSLGAKMAAERRVQQFAAFQRRIWELKTDYQRRASSLTEWAEAKVKAFGADVKDASQEQANAAIAELKTYIQTEKPKQGIEKMDVESLFAEIQTQLRVNNRSPYEPAENLTPDSIDALWANLVQAEAKYASACRQQLFSFVKKIEYKMSAEQLREYEESFDHFDDDSSGSLEADEFRAALSAVGIPFREDADFDKVFAKVSEGNKSISKAQYLKYMRMISEDKGTPEQVIQSFQDLADGSGYIDAGQLGGLSEEDRKALLANMKEGPNGSYDYKSMVQESFA